MASGLTGTVLSGANNIFFVRTELGVLECRLKGKVLEVAEREYNPLAPGDAVELEGIGGGEARIVRRLPRRSALSRFNRKRSAVQTLAANIDLLACVASVRDPEFRAGLVDRMLALAEFAGLSARLVLTKCDLAAPDTLEDELRVFGQIGVAISRVSVHDNLGRDELTSVLHGLRVVLMGHSGVGKSSLIRWLVPTWDAATAEVVSATGKGKHTTTVGTLYHGDGASFELVDTPGVRELDIRSIPAERLASCFADLQPYAGQCRFQPCTHTHEPGCAVALATSRGHINLRRLESYRRLYAEAEELQREW